MCASPTAHAPFVSRFARVSALKSPLAISTALQSPASGGRNRTSTRVTKTICSRCELELDGGDALVFFGGREGRHRFGGIKRGPEPAGIGLDISVVGLHRLNVIAPCH